MPLSPGEKLGYYEILAPLGAGGMGEVYRALDTQLEREVAIKVLPQALAADPERLARFDREARILAALNHPNIAMIHGLVESASGRALVMELVPGETLGARIKRGPMPVEEALTVARQISEALEAAHEKGIVHRDLKPGNVMITPSGVVKVLDFGLAAISQPGAHVPGDPNNSPTLTMGMTQAGAIMGTAAYMSPEQAAGTPVDRRADIWSYGVVLWEMLNGQRLFRGDTIAHTLAAVLQTPIDFEKSTAQISRQIKELLQRCLDRDVKHRLQWIGEARVAIDRYRADPHAGEIYPHGESVSQQTRKISKAAWGVAAVALLGASFLGWKLWSATRPIERPLTRLSVDLGPDAVRGPQLTVAISPDGTRIAYSARANQGTLQLFTRRLDQAQATAVTGSESVSLVPFFSPDGEWIGFFSSDSVKKVSAQGGASVILGPKPANVYGVSWGEDGNIILGTVTGLMRMPASGGPAKPITEKIGVQIFPQVLPGASAVLFNGSLVTTDFEGMDISVMNLKSGETKTLMRGGYWPRYLPGPGGTGHLVYMSHGSLLGVAFDPRSLEILGTPVPLLDDIAASASPQDGGGQFAFSDNGTFVYLSGKVANAAYPMQWLDASGKATPLFSQPGSYETPRLSPDGKKLAYTATGSKGIEVWVYDLERDTPTQLTFTGPGDREIAWAPDSKHLVYGDGSAMWWIRADGSDQPVKLADKMENPRPGSFAPDGRLIFSPASSGLPDIWSLPVDLSDPEHPKPGKAEPFLKEPSVVEVDPTFSPDGKFLAYASNESGAEDILVRLFPGPGGKWKISEAGKFPAFARATHDLYFLGSDDRIMVVSYSISGDTFTAGKPRVWSPMQIRRNGVVQSFDISADGKRAVIFPKPVVQEGSGSLHATFLLNFFDEVRRRIPAGK